MKAVIIEPSGKVTTTELPGYKELNKAVGGNLELIKFGTTGHYCYVNEDGIALQLPYNALATQLCREYQVGLMFDDFIKGNMVVVGPPDADGNEMDVSDNLILILERNGIEACAP